MSLCYSKSIESIRRALQYQTLTSGDIHYFTGDIFYYKRQSNSGMGQDQSRITHAIMKWMITGIIVV